eukprot:CAMPEP_0197535518 /NCGR_PEP_ID=MMETSP1318-20131121/50845_1 /TAXON_ID=552666 /ORGANISM="Partenskyella glossopodia, Strain RCC365" /LENGTH=112 /DNA_ID=CAMNT_0043093115 /DNA_START=773 /DNA_END=1108 /DNA_ORIENTATION=+
MGSQSARSATQTTATASGGGVVRGGGYDVGPSQQDRITTMDDGVREMRISPQRIRGRRRRWFTRGKKEKPSKLVLRIKRLMIVFGIISFFGTAISMANAVATLEENQRFSDW